MVAPGLTATFCAAELNPAGFDVHPYVRAELATGYVYVKVTDKFKVV